MSDGSVVFSTELDVSGLQSALDALDGTLGEYAQSAGEAIAARLAQGVSSGENALSGAASRVAQSALNAAQSGLAGANQIGAQLTGGIAQGVLSNAGVLTGAVRSLMARALQAARQAAQINSPSALFRDEVGAHLSAGAAEGVSRNAGLLRAAVRQMTLSAAPELSALQIQSTAASASGVPQSVQQVNHFHVPVQTPDEFAKTMSRYATYGLAGA